jgi:HSP20 family molecular chaperone IbpA
MKQKNRLLIAGTLFATLLPVTVWSYGFPGDPGVPGDRPYPESVTGFRYSGHIRLQKGENADGYYVRVYLDGLSPGDVQAYVRGNRLVLQVAQRDRYESYRPNAGSASQWQMQFRRQLRLPYDADWSRMTTSSNNDVMEIYIPRSSPYLPGDPLPGR